MIYFIYQLLFLALAAAIAFLLTPLVRKFAIKARVLDAPSERKPHDRSVPTMGGIAMFVAFFSTVCVSAQSYAYWGGGTLFPSFDMGYLFLVGTLILLFGMCDDKYRVNYKIKLAAQLVVAVLMFQGGYQIYSITNPFSDGQPVPLGPLSLPLTVLWFLFIMNAINIMDGIDGLAAGISLIALVTMFSVANYLKFGELALLAAIAVGSIAGFLRYNFYPASIFMGDSGSLFLGFLLAALSVRGAQKSSTAVALAVPIVTLGLPLLDAVAAVIRRWSSEWNASRSLSSKILSWQKIFRPDLYHIHHRLLAHGLTKRETAVLLYAVALGFGIAGFVMAAAVSEVITWMLIYMAVVFFIAFNKFPVFREMLSAKNLPTGDEQTVPTLFDRALNRTDPEKGVLRFRHLLWWFAILSLPLAIFVGYIIKVVRF